MKKYSFIMMMVCFCYIIWRDLDIQSFAQFFGMVCVAINAVHIVLLLILIVGGVRAMDHEALSDGF